MLNPTFWPEALFHWGIHWHPPDVGLTAEQVMVFIHTGTKHWRKWHNGFFLCPSYNMRVCLASVLGMPRVWPPYSCSPLLLPTHFLILSTPLSLAEKGIFFLWILTTLCFLGLDWNYLQVNLVLSEEKQKVVSLGGWLASSYPCELCHPQSTF